MEYISIEEYKSLDLSNRIIYIRLLDKLEQQENETKANKLK